MAEKMKGLVLYEKGKTEFREVDKPVCGESDIIVRVKSAAICGGDIHLFTGALDLGVYPIILGHEFAGVVDEMGPKADSRFKLGDRVVSENTSHVCGHCPACEKGNFVNCPERRTMGCDDDGAFTQYVKIPGDLLSVYPHCLYLLPEEIDTETAPLLEPASNCYMATIQEGHIMPGENVVIYGAGAIALFCVEWAKVAGAGNIIVLGTAADQTTRFPKAKELGADYTLLSTDPEIESKVKAICGDSGVATIIDCAGAPVCLKQAISIVRNDGVIVRVGMNDKPLDMGMNIVNVKSISIIGHMGYNSTSWRNTMNMVKLGKFNLKTLVTDKIPLSRAQEGFEMLKNQTSIKILLDPDK